MGRVSMIERHQFVCCNCNSCSPMTVLYVLMGPIFSRNAAEMLCSFFSEKPQILRVFIAIMKTRLFVPIFNILSICFIIMQVYIVGVGMAVRYLLIMLNLQKNYLEKYQQIYPENAEWNTIEYKLQLCLGNASLELKRVYSVVNPYLSNQFQKQNKGNIITEAYIRPDSLTGSNRIERVCQKGFEFSNLPGQNGMIFQTGQIDGINPSEKPEHELLVVRLCPRKSFPVVASEQTLSEDYPIPQGFDSLYFKQPEQDQEVYRHRFRINRKMQTLPYYIIQFVFTNIHEEKFKRMICQKCSDVAATHYCLTEKTYFCKKCDFQHHKDKISSKHQRKPLSEKPILNFGYCPNHKQNKNQLFCKECNQSMCISCKIYGTHSEGPMASHQLQKIADYFAQIATKINQMDPNLEKRKDQFQQLLAVVDSKVKQINRTTAQIQAELTQMFQDALRDLQIISRRKLSYLISDQLEIRRQYDYIQWMESFLKYQFNVLPPNSFLASWIKHLKLRKDVLNINNIPAPTDVKSNFRIYGRVRILQDQKANSFQEDFGNGEVKQTTSVLKRQTQAQSAQKEQSKESLSHFRKKLFSNTPND